MHPKGTQFKACFRRSLHFKTIIISILVPQTTSDYVLPILAYCRRFLVLLSGTLLNTVFSLGRGWLTCMTGCHVGFPGSSCFGVIYAITVVVIQGVPLRLSQVSSVLDYLLLKPTASHCQQQLQHSFWCTIKS